LHKRFLSDAMTQSNSDKHSYETVSIKEKLCYETLKPLCTR